MVNLKQEVHCPCQKMANQSKIQKQQCQQRHKKTFLCHKNACEAGAPFYTQDMVKDTDGLPVQETEQDPDITDDEYEERVMANYAAKSEDYKLFADENVTAEYQYRYRETIEKNRKDGISFRKVPAKEQDMKRRWLKASHEAKPCTKLLSIVVHRLSQREIDVVMNRMAHANALEELEFVDNLWSNDKLPSKGDRWVTTEDGELVLEMTIH